MSWLWHMGTVRLIIVCLLRFGLTVSAHLSSVLAADLEHYVHRLVNGYRASKGLKPVALNPAISAIARRHSRNMATGRVGYGHGGIERHRQEIAGCWDG